jgi:hypothetical protein
LTCIKNDEVLDRRTVQKPASLPLPTRASRIGNNPTKLGFSSFFLGLVHD